MRACAGVYGQLRCAGGDGVSGVKWAVPIAVVWCVVCGVWLAVRSQISGRGKGADAKERKRQQEPRKG
jgi:hypothetical protein